MSLLAALPTTTCPAVLGAAAAGIAFGLGLAGAVVHFGGRWWRREPLLVWRPTEFSDTAYLQLVFFWSDGTPPDLKTDRVHSSLQSLKRLESGKLSDEERMYADFTLL